MVPETKPTIVILSAFYEPFVSGAERCVKEVVERLGARYHFVVITARMDRKLPVEEIRPWGVIVRVGVGTKFDKWLYPILAPLVVRRFQSTVVHAVMESYAGIALWLHGLIGRAPRMLTLQSGDLDEKVGPRIPAWLWKKIHATPEFVTGISNYLVRRAIRLGQSAERTAVVPNGVDLAHALSSRRTSGTSRHRIVCVARLSPEKGLEYLIRSMRTVRQSIPDATLTLVGGGALEDQLKNLTISLGLTDVIEFRGALPHDETLREIASAELFVCPSLAEGLGIVFIEAQALGVPVVGTNVGGIPDVIEDGKTGLLVPPRDEHALTEAIIKMLEHPIYASELERFDWNRIAEQYADLYERLGRRAPAIVFATGIYPPDIGGPATYTKRMEAALRARGWRVSVVSYGKDVSRRWPLPVRYFLYGCAVFRRAWRSDVIFAQDSVSAGFPAYCANLLLRRPLVLKVVGDYAWEQAQVRGLTQDLLDEFLMRRHRRVIGWFEKIERRVARASDVIVTPSRYLKTVVERWGVPSEKITVIPNAVETLVIPAHAGTRSHPTIISVGRLTPWKGFDALIDVMRDLPTDARLIIIGDGPEKNKLADLIVRLGLGNRVEMTGSLPRAEVLRRMAEADVFVLNSGYEGFSHVLVEAMAAGVPVVASDRGGNPEIVRDGENGLLVPYNDRAALRVAVGRILADGQLAARLVESGKRTTSQFTEERMIQETMNTLASLCAS